MDIPQHKANKTNIHKWFAGKEAVIATMHSKETVMGPLIQETLQLNYTTTGQLINTDLLGTFSGEIERTLNPFEAAVEKCTLAMHACNAQIAFANEGSFGSHPSIPFIAADEEIVVMVDKTNNLTIAAKTVSTQTNFAGKYCTTWQEVEDFAHKIGFPSHAVILKSHEKEPHKTQKGITDSKELAFYVSNFLQSYGQVFVETDMRAMYNPTRMQVIKEATQKLLDKIMSACNNCTTPGFGVEEVVAGLPCSWCGNKTNSTFALIYQCKHCGYRSKLLYPNNKQQEDPMYCNYCNP